MNKQEFEQYEAEMRPEPVIRTDEFDGTDERLLCYGYNLDRDSVYILFSPSMGIGRFVDVDYKARTTSAMSDDEIMSAVEPYAEWLDEWPAEALRPSKRAFPQHTDLQFARLMRDRTDYGLTFTTGTWNDED